MRENVFNVVYFDPSTIPWFEPHSKNYLGIISGSAWKKRGPFRGWGSFRGRDHFDGCTVLHLALKIAFLMIRGDISIGKKLKNIWPNFSYYISFSSCYLQPDVRVPCSGFKLNTWSGILSYSWKGDLKPFWSFLFASVLSFFSDFCWFVSSVTSL